MIPPGAARAGGGSGTQRPLVIAPFACEHPSVKDTGRKWRLTLKRIAFASDGPKRKHVLRTTLDLEL